MAQSIYCIYNQSMSDLFSEQQQRFLAKVAHWLPQLLTNFTTGESEARLGSRTLPDGRIVDVVLVCRVRYGSGPGDGYQYGDHMKKRKSK